MIREEPEVDMFLPFITIDLLLSSPVIKNIL